MSGRFLLRGDEKSVNGALNDMAKSDFVAQLDAIQKAAHTKLRPLGFRKIGRSHNRATAAGLIHVINFQMGEYPIGNYVIPGIRENLYGLFTVNLGVLLPCVHRLGKFPIPRSVRDGNCTIRDRLKNPSDGQEWFSLGDDSASSRSKIVEVLEQQGLPFLRQFETYQDVLSYYQAHDDLPFQNPGRASLEAAIIARELGNIEMSNRLFEKAHETEHMGFKEYVAEIAARLGYIVG
jgi:hypothetical protein